MGLATSWQLLLLLLYYPIKKLQPIRQSTFHFNQAGEKREKFVLCLLNHGEARSRLNCILYNAPGNFWSAQIFVGGGGGTGGSESPVSPTTFSRLPYFCAPLPPDSRPSLCCFHLQVNQEDQKPGFNFQTVPKLNILVHFLAFLLAGDHWDPMKVITGQFS